MRAGPGRRQGTGRRVCQMPYQAGATRSVTCLLRHLSKRGRYLPKERHVHLSRHHSGCPHLYVGGHYHGVVMFVADVTWPGMVKIRHLPVL